MAAEARESATSKREFSVPLNDREKRVRQGLIDDFGHKEFAAIGFPPYLLNMLKRSIAEKAGGQTLVSGLCTAIVEGVRDGSIDTNSPGLSVGPRDALDNTETEVFAAIFNSIPASEICKQLNILRGQYISLETSICRKFKVRNIYPVVRWWAGELKRAGRL